MKSLIKRFAPAFFSLFIIVLVLSLVFTYAVPLILYHQSGMATISLTLSFDGIAQSRDPKGNVVNIADIRSDEVLTRAIEIAGLEDSMSVDELKPLVAAQEFAQSNAMVLLTEGKKSDGKVTTVSDELSKPGVYTVTVTDLGVMNRTKSKLLVKSLVQAYEEFLQSNYLQGASVEPECTLEEIEELDYSEMLMALSDEADSVIRYANSFTVASPDFVSADSGQSFADLVQRAKTIENTDINTYQGLISYCMLTKSTSMRMKYETHRLERARLVAEKLNTRFDAMNTVTTMYNNYTNYIMVGSAGSYQIQSSSTENTYYSALLDSLVEAKNDIISENHTIYQIENSIARLNGGNPATAQTEDQPEETMEEQEEEQRPQTAVVSTEEYVKLAKEVEDGVKNSYNKLVAIRAQIVEMAKENYESTVADKISVGQASYHLGQWGSLIWNFIALATIILLILALLYKRFPKAYDKLPRFLHMERK